VCCVVILLCALLGGSCILCCVECLYGARISKTTIEDVASHVDRFYDF